MARSMLNEYNVSHSFWVKAINTTCYYSNRLYCHPIIEKAPYELLNERKPNIAYFWGFSCKCYILKKGIRLSKFKKKCDKGFLLGYSTTSKAYRVWNMASDILKRFMMLNLIKLRVFKMRMRTLVMLEAFNFQMP